MGQESKDRYWWLSALLVTGSALLMVSSVYLIQIFATQYGIGAGALIQSQADHLNVTPILQPTTIQLNSIYKSVLESYLSLAIAFLLFVLALMLYSRRANRYDGTGRRYSMLHTTLTVIYIILFWIIYSTFSYTSVSVGIYFAYVGMAACLLADTYVEYSLRTQPRQKRAPAMNLRINPETPYSNMQLLKERLFGALQGDIGIVDKHFNSAAIENLQRLIPAESGMIRHISVITSVQMLDSGFGRNYGDLKLELQGKGIGLEVKLMTEEDAGAQHERFVMDSKTAFKIPPLNIINRKSEHITSINFRDARKRFDYLHQRAVKLENYSAKKG